LNFINATGKKMDSSGKNRVGGGKKLLAILPQSAKRSAATGKNNG